MSDSYTPPRGSRLFPKRNPTNVEDRKLRMKLATKQGRVAQAKEMNRQETEDRNKAADQGRPFFANDANTKKRLNKYVKTGLREDNLDDATKRSALHAVIQKGINDASGVNNKSPNLNDALKQTRSQISSVSKLTGFGAAAYVIGRILTPTRLGDGTKHGTYRYKKMGFKK